MGWFKRWWNEPEPLPLKSVAVSIAWDDGETTQEEFCDKVKWIGSTRLVQPAEMVAYEALSRPFIESNGLWLPTRRIRSWMILPH